MKKLKNRSLRWVLFFVVGILGLDALTFLWAEGLWFQDVDYLSVFGIRVLSQLGLGVVAFAVSFGLMGRNLAIAQRQAWAADLPEAYRPQLPGRLRLSFLLPLTVFCSVLIGLIFLYHGQVAIEHWNFQLSLESAIATPISFRSEVIERIVREGLSQVWQFVFVGGCAIATLIYPRIVLWAVSLLLSLSFAVTLADNWTKVLPALFPTAFERIDPIFQNDISFYIFQLPLWELMSFWFTSLAGFTFLSVALVYLLSGDSLSQARFPGFSRPQQRHLCGVGALLCLAIALSYWLARYKLLYSRQGSVFGASYTNVAVQLPVYTTLSLGALAIAGLLALQFLFRLRKQRIHTQIHTQARAQTLAQARAQTLAQTRTQTRGRSLSSASHALPTAPHWLVLTIALYLFVAATATLLLPLAVQRLIVQPNELQLETPFIRNAIALTRQGFNLETIDAQTFDPVNDLTNADLQQNALTIQNIRLWDTRPLLETNRQLQRIRPYYEFAGADVDRYPSADGDGRNGLRQVLIAARELDYNSVPAAAQTWVNQHLIYTHGYGFTVSPVNVAGEDGLPDYFIQGIEPLIVDPVVQGRIPFGKPRLYFGELTNTYVMTGTRVQELDYPSGSENVYNTYDGQAGVSVGNFGQRLLFGKHLRDWRMILSDDLTAETKLLFRRNIRDRVRAIAPFLRFDSDPYLVAADTGNKLWERGSQLSPSGDQSYLYWIMDAYVVSDRYPYSDPLQQEFNYIRNSVKVVVDAYHGSVNFYVSDPFDPVIQTWQKIFPNMFQPLDAMPIVLQNHLRYPQDLYRVQSEQLMTYHMTDPIVFYNREDLWRAPNEIYGDRQQLVKPYYLIMKLPQGVDEEFILFRPFTPTQRNNLIAWLAARSDGDQYGKMLLYTFPKERLVFGPEQIEARINQDPIISQQISLWNRQGSRAVQGNLLVIPINRSLLYVEPLYLEAEQNRLPTLVRVIVAFRDRIVMAETLERALAAIFQPTTNAPTIIRSVPEEIPTP